MVFLEGGLDLPSNRRVYREWNPNHGRIEMEEARKQEARKRKRDFSECHLRFKNLSIWKNGVRQSGHWQRFLHRPIASPSLSLVFFRFGFLRHRFFFAFVRNT